jgi:diguanylate cyclase
LLKYQHSIERSTEYFRLALPLMTKQAAGLHPLSYAVWYGYVSGDNPNLRLEVDRQLQAGGGVLDEARTQSLFWQHVAEADPAAAQKMTDGVDRVLHGMAESAALAGSETARYGSTLTRLSTQLANSASNPVLQELQGTTCDMQRAIEQLQKRLDESQAEITGLRDEVERTRRESLLDCLTGLANRRAFEQSLEVCITQASAGAAGAPPCLVLADIDHFKRINDRFGHGFGDQVIRAVGQVLKTQSPEHAMAARIGGEEFALLLPAASVQAGQVLAEKIRTTVGASRIRRSGQTDTQTRVSLSLGIAGWKPGQTAQELIERADRALYEAKNGGRDCVRLAA